MNYYSELLIIILTSYIIGSLPYGLILVKLFKNKDIRTIGSKNIGATNVLRAGYPILALFTLLLDGFKGFIAVIIFKYFIVYTVENAAALAGLFAMVGHVFPIWLKFKGGKGVATTFGTILALNPIIALLSLATWLITAIISKYSSLSAIIAMILLPLWSYFLDKNLTYYFLIIAILVLIRHKNNFINLIQGKESKINFKKKKT